MRTTTAVESLRVSHATDPHPGYGMVKRAVDVLAAATGIAVLMPLLLVIAALVKFGSPGPVLFRQDRCGMGGRTFVVLKFRTMVDGADEQADELAARAARGEIASVDAPAFKAADDPRLTPIGRILRRFSLDELPQLLNILRGEMTLVGPRPLVMKEALLLSEAQQIRHAVRPGLTCIWQTSGRSRVPYQRRMEMDIEYVQRRSLWLDFVLLLKTPVAVFGQDGAY